MFDSIYSAAVTTQQFFIMAGIALAAGVLYSWILSFRIYSTNRFFLVTALIPFCVGTVLTFVSGNIGAGVAFGGAFALIRFRSAQGTADEIAAILIAMAGGIGFGMGYVAYGVCILIGLSLFYFVLAGLRLFEHKSKASEQLLQVTIPEALDFNGVFDDTFSHYLRTWSGEGVKSIAMGSMFRLSFKVRMKDPAEEKAFIDELRTKNGNLEIALLPYVAAHTTL